MNFPSGVLLEFVLRARCVVVPNKDEPRFASAAWCNQHPYTNYIVVAVHIINCVLYYYYNNNYL